MSTNEPAGPVSTPRKRRRWLAVLITVAVIVVGLRVAGLIGIYQVPTANMVPELQVDDQFFEEAITYLFRKPHRGEIILFSTDGINSPGIIKSQIYVKRVVGLPGEEVRIEDGNLYVDGVHVPMICSAGPVTYVNAGNLPNGSRTLKVPAGQYFVLGDNSANSFDSRYYGCVAEKFIRGRAVFRYAPLNRVGSIL